MLKWDCGGSIYRTAINEHTQTMTSKGAHRVTDPFTAIATTVGIVGVVGSLAFSGWQTRQLARQTETQNAIAMATIVHNTADRLNATYRVFVDYPELRAYFYDGAPSPATGPERARALTVAEMLGDVLDALLYTTSKFAARGEYDDWIDYIEHILDQSPTLTRLILEHPKWWPQIENILTRKQQATTGDTG